MTALHLGAYRYSLYFTVEWFDMMMHFLGGFLVGSSIGWLLRFEVPIGLRSLLPTFWIIIIGVLSVALAWEAFELVAGIAPSIGYQKDTIEDIMLGLIGAVVAYGIFKK
ncbi:hypothetical protein COU15_02115 [Candidatus Kaiserbacteria bacterium CG10_big_fil_rev_8_21_14_0_10_45_20]|uniref:VanZ-like domain-containing protein n=1 Tax=Candidatus Kaiserbacteria bacterium CG10_big_fil_rev_8_21_14_0_10_45_20 TaxID=1974607 RepID=A0A2H0UFJ1_9BACT|nr:MAG: hypothetical protein COU15_02115 [Candidatus Kaiserbacteria bacterium CG10_big_fil_rev_8_21_14_0_10_45_20]